MPRHPNHDYKSMCTYHITLSKIQSVSDFSVLTGRPESCYVYHSPIGKAIEKCLNSISEINPNLKIYRYSIMPDHVHILIGALKYLDSPLGIYIGKIKVKSLQNARERGIFLESLFEPDFHDRILRPHHSLNAVFQYIKQNPYRLLVRKFYPEYFQRINSLLKFEKLKWNAYGNMQLLNNPFVEAVICHRKDVNDPEIIAAKKENWIHLAQNGGVLISPFISPKEKEIRNMAEEENSKVILIINKSFGDRYKPAAHDFEQCHKGNLLIIAPETSLPDCRATYLQLNRLAEYLAKNQ